MSILNKAFRPNREAAKEHVKLTIKYYSQMDINTYRKQLEIAERGLYVAGFTKEEARQIMFESIKEDGLDD